MLRAIAAALIVATALPAAAERVVGAARVLDGDTIVIGATQVRLLHIDAPETGQPHGREAGAALAALAGDRRVACEGRSRDGYGRLLATCSAGGIDLNRAMVAAGHAAVFRRYGDTYDAEEQASRAARLGMWRDAYPVMPWDFRAARWQSSDGAAPDPDCPIKGNINARGERIYHAPWSRWYERTRVSLSAGERWFCSEADALQAGWRAPRS